MVLRRISAICVCLVLATLSLFALLGCSASVSTSTAPAAPTATTTKVATTPASSIPITTTVAPKYGGVLKLVLPTTTSGTLGYPPTISGMDATTSQLCMDSLLRSTWTNQLAPWLAESYKVADDYKSITFNLRKGVKFHDGTEFNAQAAKWNLDNVIAAKTQPDWASVDVLDDYTIRVNLNQFRNTTLSDFADTSFSWMISPTAFQKNGLDWVKQNPVGTGPYKFVSFTRDVSFKTVKNPDYWVKGKPYLDGIDIYYVPDPQTRLATMQSGGGDAVFLTIGKESADYASIKLKVSTLVSSINALIFDTVNTDSIFANQKVREAVEYAIDREAIAKLGYGYLQAPYQIPGRDTVVYNPNFSLARKYDLEKAKQLLTEAGYPNGFDTTIIAAPLSFNADLNIALQSYLAKAGIRVNFETPDLAKWYTYLMGNWKNSMLLSPIGGYANWSTTLNFYFSYPNPVRFKSLLRTPEFLSLYNASLNSKVSNVDLIRAAADQLIKEVSVIPVIEAGNGYAYQPYVMDAGWLTRSAPAYFNLESIWLNK